ncbi:hypothetical protein HHI36_009553 [Cryptolaemus montrouzieri]|uniref:Uncharacterized protein n=1 Tax=Cryptolaemus montrouzieri TaxID=559131 RepID=A0ABD2MG14_9CUCU
MISNKVRYLLIFVLLLVFFGGCECWGSRTSGSRPRPSPTHRPFPRPSPTHRPFPSPTYRPFPSPTHRPFPSPTFRPFPQPTFRPFPQPTSRPFPQPTSRPFPQPTSRPFPQPTSRPFPQTTHRPFPQPTFRPLPPPTSRPFPQPTSRPLPQPTYRPFPQPSPTYRPFPTKPATYRPFPQHTTPTYRPYPNYPTSRPNYGTRAPTRYPTQPTRYPTQGRYPVGPHPSYPGYNGGIFAPGRPYQPSYSVPVRIPSPGGSRIKVYNVHNYHPSTYWAPPSYPVYRYTYRDTGNSALGFYLGYSLGRVTHPTYYYHHHGYDGYSPRYDHYTVHHYYHNTGNIPKEQTVVSKSIIQCGDSSQICPANTTALCTSNGQIMCVVVADSTIPCKQDANLRCVRSMVPCENNEAPECKGIAKGQSTAIDIPCISNTIVEGNITTVNNTILSTEKSKNITTVPLSGLMNKNLVSSTTPVITTIRTIETTLPAVGLSNSNISFPSSPVSSTTTVRTTETTLPAVGLVTSNVTFPSLDAPRSKRSAPQYCVTILAQPSVRALTEGEQAFQEATNIFEKFFSKAFGMG